MNALRIIDSRTVVMPAKDIDTDQIVPARFLTTTSKEGLGDVVFNDLRRDADGNENVDFVLNDPATRECRILVAGNNFGCGSSREHAPWALLDYGFQAVISTEIADIFRSNSLKNGLVPIVVEPDVHQRLLDNPGVNVRIDLQDLTLTVADAAPIPFAMESFARFCLLNGVDQLGYIQQHNDAIAAYEAHQ